jgi:peroxiredoxin
MNNRNFLLMLCAVVLLASCQRSAKFDVEGTISHASGKTLYFERIDMDKTSVLDSIKLEKDGDFHFKTKLGDEPEFYRLRIENRFIHLAADSTAYATVTADGINFGQAYRVTGSHCCEQIRFLSDLQDRTLLQVDSLNALRRNRQISDADFQEKLLTVFDRHRDAARKVIYENPLSPAAYFALFQRLHNYLIFDPFDAFDNRCFAAVGTSWDTFHPNSVRSQHLKLLTLQGMKEIRKNRDASKIEIVEKNNLSLFEIKLPNVYGKEVALSSLKGNVILLDFTAFRGEYSPSRNLMFRELYNKFSKRGFRIYQVSFDSDEQFWKSGAVNLPWVCVRDRNTVQSESLSSYNVQSLPTYFLIDRKGDIVVRDVMVQDLNKEILKLL